MVAIKERKRLSKLRWRRKSNSASGKSSEGLLLSIGSGIIAFSGGRLRRPHHQHHKKSAYYITIRQVNISDCLPCLPILLYFQKCNLKVCWQNKSSQLFLTKEILGKMEVFLDTFFPIGNVIWNREGSFQKNFKYFCVFFQSNVQQPPNQGLFETSLAMASKEIPIS